MSYSGDTVKEALQEAGISYTNARTNISGEYTLLKINKQVTKPFIREHFFEAKLPYDTLSVLGDRLTLSDNREMLIAHMTPLHVDNDDIAFLDSTLLKCNVSGELLFQSGETRNNQQQLISTWAVRSGECFALLYNEDYGNFLDQDSPVGQVTNRALFLYVPKSVGIQSLDRYVPVSGEFLKVEEVDRYRYSGIDVAHLEQDTRE